MPSYGGVALFGTSVSISHVINPSAQQINEFFGLAGMQSLFGGFRGRVFLAQGVLFGVNAGAINAVEGLFFSYCDDGIARVLIDTRGRGWSQVLMTRFQPAQRIKSDARGYYLDYRAEFRGLI